MRHTGVDGILFADMMKSALKNLQLYEAEINDLNVFPVPDGDTGTNMRRTVELGVESATPTLAIGSYLKELSQGMLLGARGNSGVILSQIFSGFSAALARYESASAVNLVAAFIKGYLSAYAAVIRPVEGTILTVVREGIERTKKQIYRRSSIEDMLGIFISEMKKSLMMTPFLLPVLKEAGVVDSGAFGFIKIVEGMVKCLYGEEIATPEIITSAEHKQEESVDTYCFDVNSKFDFGYCTEFTLQLMNRNSPVRSFSLEKYIEDVKMFGESLVVLRDGNRVRVHVHTFKPEKVIEISRRYGEFVFFKLDNMQLQNNEVEKGKAEKRKPAKRKELAIIAVADGEGIADTFKGLGCDLVIDGGKTMNTSVKEFLDAYAAVNAERVLVLPNDKNIIQTALQAKDMYKGSVEVISSKSMAQGYFALASDMPDSPAEDRINAIKKGAEGVDTVTVDRSARDRKINGIECLAGSYVGVVNGEIKTSKADITSATIEALKAFGGIKNKEQLLIFIGKNPLPDGFEGALEEQFPDKEINYVEGGESGDELIIGIV